jgi:hypothetical protein
MEVKMIRAALVAAVAALSAAGASAELFKCVQAGRTTFQEQPCDPGSNETRMPGSTGAVVEWLGCYDTIGPGRRNRNVLRIRSGPDGAVLETTEAREVLPLRPMTRKELLRMEDGMRIVSGGDRYLDGIAAVLPESSAWPKENVYGIYRLRRAGTGTEELHAALPTAGYTVEKVPCKPS